jgi:hypothetical protein
LLYFINKFIINYFIRESLSKEFKMSNLNILV